MPAGSIENMSKRILIIGAGGQLGGAVADEFRAHGWEVAAPARRELDVENGDPSAHIASLVPDVVLNASWFPVIPSEEDPERAHRVNALGQEKVARASAKIGAVTIFASTDYVFDGTKTEGFTESDEPHPLNAYGASKLAGERSTRGANPRHYIVRTSALFGRHAKPEGNFVLRMLRRAERNEETSVTDQEFTRPTSAEDVARTICRMLDSGVPFGIYHVTNEGEASWYALAERVFAYAGKVRLLKRAVLGQGLSAVVRPKHSLLRNHALWALGLPPLPRWEEALDRYLHSL